MDDDTRRAIALFRFGVLGPLVSARLEHGDRRAHFEAAARRDYVTPDGRIVRISARTIEAWYYAYRKHGLSGLGPASRGDCGASRSMSAEVADLVVRAKQEKPRRSIRRIIRMLERAGRVRPGELSRSSVHRLLAGKGISQRPTRAEDADGQVAGSRVERRSYIAEHVGDLWVGDALHVRRPVAFPDGYVGKAYMLSQIDSASRYVPHSYFAPHEEDSDQEHGLRQAILKYGVPRAYYVDRGPAYVAGLARGDLRGAGVPPPARRAQGRRGQGRHRALAPDVARGGRGRAAARGHRAERSGVGALRVAGARVPPAGARHDGGGSPRSLPVRGERASRRARGRQARGDLPAPQDAHGAQGRHHPLGGRLAGGAPRAGGQEDRAALRPARRDALPKVFREGRFYCDTVPLDRIANAHRERRRITGEPAPGVEPTGIDPLAQLVEEHAWASRLVHLSEDDDDNESEDIP